MLVLFLSIVKRYNHQVKVEMRIILVKLAIIKLFKDIEILTQILTQKALYHLEHTAIINKRIFRCLYQNYKEEIIVMKIINSVGFNN